MSVGIVLLILGVVFIIIGIILRFAIRSTGWLVFFILLGIFTMIVGIIASIVGSAASFATSPEGQQLITQVAPLALA